MTPLRASLMFPPNAVPDTGIDLHRPKGIRYTPKDITLSTLSPPTKLWFWPVKQITLDDIVEAAAEVFDVSRKDLLSCGRHKPLVTYRMAAMAVCCHLTSATLTRIGQKFGGKDHASIINARNKMAPHIAAVAAELPSETTPVEWCRAMKARIAA